jgi:hypothetical protein
MLVAAGNINQPYDVIGVVHAVVTRTPKKAGCGTPGGLPIQEAYEAVTAALSESAQKSGATGLINVHYDYRLSSTSVGCGGNTEAVFEVYGWGTAVKLS